jgi:hypothetical protein
MFKTSNEAITSTVKHWGHLSKETFFRIFTSKSRNVITIKFRDVATERYLLHSVEPFNGIRFMDVVGSADYFIGAFIIINTRIWKIIPASQTIVLWNLKDDIKLVKKTTKVRDDGFLKVYRSLKRSLIITTI